MKIDYVEKLKESLMEKYSEKFGGKPNVTMDKLIDCIDEELCDNVFADVKDLSKNTNNMLNDAKHRATTITESLDTKLMEADRKIAELEEKISIAEESSPIQNPNLREALCVYKDLVNMKFDTAAMGLQNVQNASYFLWAWLMGDRGLNQDFKSGGNPMKGGPVTSVKEETEDDDDFNYRHGRRYH